MSTMYDKVKRMKGETYAKAIRNYDNGIFDIPDLLDIIRYAGRKVEPIMNYLVSLKDIKIEEQGAYEDPITLLDRAGYNAYYADTLEKQNAIRKYYAPGEELCTFRDKGRFKDYYIINAVRKDVDKIKRKNFVGKEKREDEYGTSVLSIQILKKGGFISIKNRYNHTVENPDNTLYSNPDNIISGLSQSLKNFFKVDFSSQEECLPEGFTLFGRQVVKYNYEKNNVYFGSDFYARNGIIYPLDKNKEIMMDTCILNVKERTLCDPSLYEKCSDEEDYFIDRFTKRGDEDLPPEFNVFTKELRDKKITITKQNGCYHVRADGVRIVTIEDGEIVGLNLPTTRKVVGFGFLRGNKRLSEFHAPKLEDVGECSLVDNVSLEELDLPKAKFLGHCFLTHNKVLGKLCLPEVREIDGEVLEENTSLERLNLPKVREIGYGFLEHNKILAEFNAPEVEEIDAKVLERNRSLRKITLPKVRKIGDSFLAKNEILAKFIAPKLEEIENYVLEHNESLKKINLPKTKEIGKGFLHYNKILTEFNAPEVEEMGNDILYYNNSLKKVVLPKVEIMGGSYCWGSSDGGVLYEYINTFLHENKVLTEFIAPNLSQEWIGGMSHYLKNVFLNSDQVIKHKDNPEKAITLLKKQDEKVEVAIKRTRGSRARE